jgi:predicted RNA-binding Zn-ribbon protein involved in translation (DUF1610 family)
MPRAIARAAVLFNNELGHRLDMAAIHAVDATREVNKVELKLLASASDPDGKWQCSEEQARKVADGLCPRDGVGLVKAMRAAITASVGPDVDAALNRATAAEVALAESRAEVGRLREWSELSEYGRVLVWSWLGNEAEQQRKTGHVLEARAYSVASRVLRAIERADQSEALVERRPDVLHFRCPQCGAEHDRGWINGVSMFRCLGCGYTGPSADSPADRKSEK